MVQIKKLLVCFAIIACSIVQVSALTATECQQIQDTAHQMAECARQLGYPEDSVIIQEAQKKWWEAENAVWSGPVLTARAGTVMGPSGKETYYNLPMQGVVNIMRNMGFDSELYPYWVRSDGCKMLGDYIMVAANLDLRPRGSIVETSRGRGLVCDTGGFARYNPYQLDLACQW